ncbi:MAG TPA: DoxX family membrane protein [archaeon]|nr:DoxX family membrane protein [archaeon]
MTNESVLEQRLGRYSNLQLCFLAFLRVVVGWHFLYEGYVKIISPGWSSAGYLNAVPGPLANLFKMIVETPWMLTTADYTMKYGLTAIGIALILGLFTRLASVGAALLLVLFYISNPPWVGVQTALGEGNYLIVNKNLVEFAAVLLLLVFPSGLVLGFDRLFIKE